jgi:hypothetical protein
MHDNKKRCKIIEFKVQEESWDWEGGFDVVVVGGGLVGVWSMEEREKKSSVDNLL